MVASFPWGLSRVSRLLIAVLVTLGAALAFLLLSPGRPARALEVTLGGLPVVTTQGPAITFSVDVLIPAGEALSVESVAVNISGPTPISVTFNAAGTILAGDPRVDLVRVTTTQNVPYGRSVATRWTYHVRLLTGTLQPGNYTARAQVRTNSYVHPLFSSPTTSFSLAPAPTVLWAGRVRLTPGVEGRMETPEGRVRMVVPSQGLPPEVAARLVEVELRQLDSRTVPPSTAGATVVHPIELNTWVDGLLTPLVYAAPVEVSFSLTSMDLALAGGDVSRLRLMRFDPALGEWAVLPTRYLPGLPVGGVLVTSVDHFSMLAVVVSAPVVPPTPTVGTTPPVASLTPTSTLPPPTPTSRPGTPTPTQVASPTPTHGEIGPTPGTILTPTPTLSPTPVFTSNEEGSLPLWLWGLIGVIALWVVGVVVVLYRYRGPRMQ